MDFLNSDDFAFQILNELIQATEIGITRSGKLLNGERV
jgi:hypothetical protein